jgi:hypothetical protein
MIGRDLAQNAGSGSGDARESRGRRRFLTERLAAAGRFGAATDRGILVTAIVTMPGAARPAAPGARRGAGRRVAAGGAAIHGLILASAMDRLWPGGAFGRAPRTHGSASRRGAAPLAG